MSLHYYNRLEKGNLDAAIELQENTFEALTPFYQYIDTTIKSLKRKEDIRANWNIVATEKIQLKRLSFVYKIEHKTQIKILQETNWYLAHNFPDDANFSDELIIKEVKKKFPINASDIRVEGNSTYIQIPDLEFPSNKKNLKVDWGFYEFEITSNSVSIDDIQSIKYNHRELDFQIENGKILLNGKMDSKKTILINDQPVRYEIVSDAANDGLSKECKVLKESLYESIVLSDKTIKGLVTLSIHDLVKELEIDPTTLTLEGNKSKFSFTHLDDEETFLFTVDNPADFQEKILVSPNGIRFQCAIVKPDSKNRFLIQLIEIEDNKEDDPYSQSPIDYFFDEEVKVKDEHGNEYDIGFKNQEEKQILLKQKGKDVIPNTSSKYLSVKVSTYQLFKQQEAIRNIQYKPVREQRNLLKLFEPRNQVSWNHTLENSNISNWHVLKEENRAGCLEQREFINKAMSTSDFAILEGPPGSGKTTVILELICQLIERNQRVLLCGSTHVAIDNVLERLKAKGLMENLSIAPIRIGKDTVISEEIKEYRLENQLEVQNVSERLLLESSNLVCGTTIGILQYPEFKEQREEATPIIPKFDYLIIDECSKTTFQEFLVPAFYAKKWILVGDIQQLSPFTDREQIISNLRDLDLGKDIRTNQRKMLSKNLQDACYKLYLILQFSNTKRSSSERKFNKLAFVLDNGATSEIRKEIQERLKRDNPLKYMKFCYYESSIALKDLCEADIIFIDRKNIDSALNIVPEYFIVLGYPDWLKTSHYFKHRFIHQKGTYQFEVFHKGKSTNNFERIYELIEEQMKEKDWAEELTWRLIRDFELRNKNRDYQFRKDLEDLYPATESAVKTRINTLRNIALPSILEGMQKGIKGKYNQERTTLTEGFTLEELKLRHGKLKYQHRMHSDIAKYPREAFYHNQALLTDSNVDNNRQWKYNAYPKRSIWINVNGKTIGNKNFEEASSIIREIEKFIHWAKSQKHPEPLDNDGKWKIACLAFYKGQEKILREKLQSLCSQPNKHSQFMKDNVKIFLYTVDKFQGQEADIVFLSMVQTRRDGFLDNPNRLNVAITRARFQLVIVGNHDYFVNKSHSDELKNLAKNTNKVEMK